MKKSNCPELLQQFTTIHYIDEAIQKHRAAIIGLQRRRNSLTPIGHLPPEILSTIFLFLVLDGKSTFNYKFSPRPISSSYWVAITFVCHYWREVSLNSQRLWSFLGSNMSTRLGTCISRSKGAPLHFRLSRPPSWYLHRVLGDPNIRDRIEEFHVEVRGEWLNAMISQVDGSSTEVNSTQRPSPIRSLRLRNTTHLLPPILELPMIPVSRQFPKLWRLELIGCNIGWNSSIFTSSILTRLTIHQVSVSSPPEMSQLIAVLKRQHRLEKLDLTFGDNSVARGNVGHVHLPCLRKLKLSGPLLYCFDLATHLFYPRASTVVAFHVRLGPAASANTPSVAVGISDIDFGPCVLNFLSWQYGSRDSSSNANLPIIRHLSLKADHLRYEADIWSILGPSCHIGIKWRLPSGLLSIGRGQRMTRALCAMLPLTQVRKLTLSGITIEDDWFHAFGGMAAVEELEIGDGRKRDGTTVVAVVLALEPQFEGGDITLSETIKGAFTSAGNINYRRVGAPPYVPLPNLQRLYISDTNFDKFEQYGSSLSLCLRSRSEVHIGLKSLVLRRCSNLSRSEVDTYIEMNVAEAVDWDEF